MADPTTLPGLIAAELSAIDDEHARCLRAAELLDIIAECLDDTDAYCTVVNAAGDVRGDAQNAMEREMEALAERAAYRRAAYLRSRGLRTQINDVMAMGGE